MNTVTESALQKFDVLCENRKQEILHSPDTLQIHGTTYYVSNDGNDASDGLSPQTAWKTLAKVSEAPLCKDDGVLFRRGDLFRGRVITHAGVSYGAFGSGEKPKFYGWDKNLANPALWVETDSTHHIWKLTEKILDPGTLVFNEGQNHSVKLIPSYIGGRFVCRENENKPFCMEEEMVRDLDIYWHFEDILTTEPSRGKDFPVPEMGPNSLGDLYLRCDKGNPGEVFASIEAVTRRSMFYVRTNNNVRIDNLCIKYVGVHAVAAAGVRVSGLKVTNCEIGWIGGTIQHYLGTDPNYPQGDRGTVTRFGNGVEIYGGCDDFVVSDCYIYQVYDAGITHQVSTFGQKREMTNIIYKDNLVENCVYSIEYFLDMNENDTECYMDGIEISGNILRYAGYGWGQQRHNVHTPAHIKGWSYINKASNFNICRNIFDRSAYRLLHLVAEKPESCPKMQGNTYIQHSGGMLGQYGANEENEPDILPFDEQAEHTIYYTFGDKSANILAIK